MNIVAPRNGSTLNSLARKYDNKKSLMSNILGGLARSPIFMIKVFTVLASLQKGILNYFLIYDFAWFGPRRQAMKPPNPNKALFLQSLYLGFLNFRQWPATRRIFIKFATNIGPKDQNTLKAKTRHIKISRFKFNARKFFKL